MAHVNQVTLVGHVTHVEEKPGVLHAMVMTEEHYNGETHSQHHRVAAYGKAVKTTGIVIGTLLAVEGKITYPKNDHGYNTTGALIVAFRVEEVT